MRRDSGQVRVDNPLARIDPALTMPSVPSRTGEAAVVFGHAHVPKPSALATPRPVPAGPPPEVGLTQHALGVRIDHEREARIVRLGGWPRVLG